MHGQREMLARFGVAIIHDWAFRTVLGPTTNNHHRVTFEPPYRSSAQQRSRSPIPMWRVLAQAVVIGNGIRAGATREPRS